LFLLLLLTTKLKQSTRCSPRNDSFSFDASHASATSSQSSTPDLAALHQQVIDISNQLTLLGAFVNAIMSTLDTILATQQQLQTDLYSLSDLLLAFI
jgi:hypothetical protein